MADLPFKFTPSVRRYLEELVDFVNEYYELEGDESFGIWKYAGEEYKTPKSEENRKSLFKYLEETGAVWSDAEYGDSQNDDPMLVRILDPQKVKDLSNVLERKLLGSKHLKPSFDANTKILTVDGERIRFQQHAAKVRIFEILFDRYKKEGGPIDGASLAYQSDFVQSKTEYPGKRKRLAQTVTDINKRLHKHSLHIRRENGGFELIDRKVKGL